MAYIYTYMKRERERVSYVLLQYTRVISYKIPRCKKPHGAFTFCQSTFYLLVNQLERRYQCLKHIFLNSLQTSSGISLMGLEKKGVDDFFKRKEKNGKKNSN